MSREIKFRIWDKRAKEMSTQTVSPSDWGDYLVDFKDGANDIAAEYCEWLQYTGLKDKNGVEIYEGDIIKMPADLWIGNESVGEAKDTFKSDAFIEYIDGSFRLNKLGYNSKNYYGVLNYSVNNMADKLEVIGNIYENPELLN